MPKQSPARPSSSNSDRVSLHADPAFPGTASDSLGVSVLLLAACSVGWFVLLLVHEEVLLASLCERKILFRLEIYDRLRQATVK